MRCIDADTLKKSVLDLHDCYNGFSDTYDKACIIGVIDEEPTIEPEHGTWEEKSIETVAESHITEVQVAMCSRCRRYHTTPYLHGFNDFDFCPHCGAEMDGGTRHDTDK